MQKKVSEWVETSLASQNWPKNGLTINLWTTQIGTQIPQLGTRTGYPVFSINLDETVESEINTEEILNAFFLDIESILKIAEYANCRVC